MPEPRDISLLILAGGEGRRLGGQQKGLMQWHGKATAALLKERFESHCADVFISANSALEEYQKICPKVLPDAPAFEHCGPLAGIATVGAALNSDYVLVLAADCPDVPADLIAQLTGPGRIRYARHGGRDHYLQALLHRNAVTAAANYLLQGQRKVRDFYAEMSAIAVDCAAPTLAFRNINSPEDLK